jgi:hypothetical protein
VRILGVAAAVAVTASLLPSTSAMAAPPPDSSGHSAATANVCLDTGIAAALVGKVPGDLLATPQDVTTESGLTEGRLYRIAYATTGDGGSVIASCGLVALPLRTSLTSVIAWAHGTVGLKQVCQPSMNPASFVSSFTNGPQNSGALVSMLRSGAAVTATDYPSQGMGSDQLQRYVLGVAEGVAVIDSARVVTGNPAAFGLDPIPPTAELPLVTWGHSQGGGSALWAGQLARQYLELQSDSTLDLAGVAALAPASQLTASPGQPANLIGYHLGDRAIYNREPGLGVPFPLGAVLFSFVTASWGEVRNATAGPLPFGPTTSVSPAAVLTADGLQTAPVVAGSCLAGRNLVTVALTTAKYLNPDRARMFLEPFAGSKVKGQWTGAIDKTCANPPGSAQAVQDWCAWMQFHTPGPYGVNPYSKVPVDNSGAKVPVYLAQGRNDRIIWCVDALGPVSARNCLTAQLYGSMKAEYCPRSAHLDADYFAGIDHLQVPAAAATNPKTKAYAGSPLEQFVSGAIAGTLPRTCTVNNMRNPLPQ